MPSEIEDLKEHLTRFRRVTLRSLDLVTDEELRWRPGEGHYTLGQQFLHIAQAEDFQIQGHLHGNWDFELVRFPEGELTISHIREVFQEVRSRTLEALDGIDEAILGRLRDLGEDQPKQTLRSWLWYIVEHEVHHKAQIAVYLRQMGKTPPFFASPLPEGQRPDVDFREQLGGF